MEPHRILIVEDQLLTAHVLKEHLLKQGYNVCGIASNYGEAMKLLISEDPDLALIDIILEGPLDGIATALALLRQKDIPVIYLTSNSEEETFKRAKITNPASFLYKPYRESELINQVELAIHNFYSTSATDNSGIDDRLFIPFDKSHVRIDKSDIIYIEAQRNYSTLYLTSDGYQRVYGDKRKHLPLVVTFNLGYLSNSLSANFYRLSNSILINLAHINRIDNEVIYLGIYQVPMPDGKYKKLLEQVNTIKNRQ
ncbi:response regulator [Larkinella rosea]|uniref:DNA-binding response regulator n=1 Tax=Larkinella rosea TaxID=2025312 RepID=A0A3P1BCN5_9BACT|nr:response regulator [Larkinella rosea]RRA98635.1 DNA-binding response regulator [Larkinella rosea]